MPNSSVAILPESLLALAKEKVAISATLFAGYADVNDKVANAVRVKADKSEIDCCLLELKGHENKFDTASSVLDSRIHSAIWEEIIRTTPQPPPEEINENTIAKQRQLHDARYKELTKTFEAHYQAEMSNWYRANLDLYSKASDTNSMLAAFQTHYLDNPATPKENIDLPFVPNDAVALVSLLLNQNPGVAVSDTHWDAQAAQFIYANAAALRASGVKRFYMESDENMLKNIALFKSMSPEQRQQWLDDPNNTTKSEQTAKESAEIYLVDKDNYSTFHNCAMIIALLNEDIEIVNIDKTGASRNRQNDFSGTYRAATTNFTMTDAIKKNLAEHPLGEGEKYLLYVGEGHVTTFIGKLDEALGIPTLDLRKLTESTNGFAKRFNNLDGDGPDFTIHSPGSILPPENPKTPYVERGIFSFPR